MLKLIPGKDSLNPVLWRRRLKHSPTLIRWGPLNFRPTNYINPVSIVILFFIAYKLHLSNILKFIALLTLGSILFGFLFGLLCVKRSCNNGRTNSFWLFNYGLFMTGLKLWTWAIVIITNALTET